MLLQVLFYDRDIGIETADTCLHQQHHQHLFYSMTEI